MKNSKTNNAKVNFHEAQKKERFREIVSLQLYCKDTIVSLQEMKYNTHPQKRNKILSNSKLQSI